MVFRAAQPDQPSGRQRHLFLQPAHHELDHASAGRSRAATCASDLDAAGRRMAIWRAGAAGARPGATRALGPMGDAAGTDLRASYGESAGRTGLSAAVFASLCGLLGAVAIGRSPLAD